MSLNSLQDDMSRRAASMAAMAKSARNPEQIQAIQKSLIAGVQSGAIKPYVGIPLIQELTNKLAEAKAKMAQAVTGAGMPQPPQGGPPIAQQVMQQASQESQGVEALPSNLPQSYAGGGIIAFEDGGQVERYQNAGFTGTTAQVGQLGYDQLMKLFQTDPALAREAALRAGPTGERFLKAMSNVARASTVPLAVGEGGAAATTFASGVTGAMSPEQRRNMYSNPMLGAMSGDTSLAAAIQNAPNMEKPTMGYGEQMGNIFSTLGKTIVSAPGDKTNPKGYGLSRLFAPDDAPAVAPTATPAATGPILPYGQSKVNLLDENAGGGGGGGGGFKMPTMQTYTPTIATLPERTAPILTDLDALTKKLPAETKKATETAVTATQKTLEDMDRPGFEAREGRLGQREAGLERESAISRALTGIKTGLRIAGSKERTLAGALGNEGSQGIEDLIRGEAANRAAKNKLEDYRDNLEQQKVAAKKGNYQAAQAAGERAADNLYKYTNLNLNAASAGNSQALQRQQIEQTGDIGKATVANQGQQLQLSAVDQQNRSALGIAQLAQQGSIAKAQLAAQEKRFTAMDEASKARIMQATAKGLNDFMMGEGSQLRQQLAKDYGPNFMTAQDARSLEAQRIFNQRKQAYLADIRGQAIDALSARPSGEL